MESISLGMFLVTLTAGMFDSFQYGVTEYPTTFSSQNILHRSPPPDPDSALLKSGALCNGIVKPGEPFA